MTNSDGVWIMATIIPFPVTKRAEDNKLPFAFVDTDIARAGRANIVWFSAIRASRAIQHPIDKQETTPDWTRRTL